jgi:hypothetical protein
MSTSETCCYCNKQCTYNVTLQCVRVTTVSMHIRSLVIPVGVDVAVNNINVLWVAMETQQWVPVELKKCYVVEQII